MQTTDVLERGREAFDRCRWPDAYELLEPAVFPDPVFKQRAFDTNVIS